MTIRRALVLTLALAGLLGGMVPSVRAASVDVSPIDCLGPAPDAEPGTNEWTVRDRQNIYCALERLADTAQHPAGGFTARPRADTRSAIPFDEYTVPERHDGSRFRFSAVTVTNRAGLSVPVELYRPCAPGACQDMASTLTAYAPPYPVVVLVPGGFQGLGPGAPKELYRWAAQGLAEAGYMTALHDIESAHLEDAQDVLGWVLSDANPWRAEADGDHVGIAGHSGGGATASLLGFLDQRIDAIVSLDRSSRYSLPEDDADITKPALYFVGDYGLFPHGITTYDEHPDPDGTGNKVDSFVRLRSLGVDTMHLALRATTHGDWSPRIGNRYTAIVTLYYTLAWFDRYLKGATDSVLAADAFERLTASAFDESSDIHYISQGFYDPAKAAVSADPYAGNVPYTLAGKSAADRLSFYFRSRCFISTPDGTGRATSDDMRTEGCSSS